MRVDIDLADRRARQDVVELLQEQQLPEPVELLARVRASARDREKLGVVQCLLAAPVAAFHRGLRRVHAAVVLEVELADHDRPLGRLGFERSRRTRPRSPA